jgi:hypothetical protein
MDHRYDALRYSMMGYIGVDKSKGSDETVIEFRYWCKECQQWVDISTEHECGIIVDGEIRDAPMQLEEEYDD